MEESNRRPRPAVGLGSGTSRGERDADRSTERDRKTERERDRYKGTRGRNGVGNETAARERAKRFLVLTAPRRGDWGRILRFLKSCNKDKTDEEKVPPPSSLSLSRFYFWRSLSLSSFCFLAAVVSARLLTSFAQYRAMVRTAKPPLLPYLGIDLTDLTFIDQVH